MKYNTTVNHERITMYFWLVTTRISQVQVCFPNSQSHQFYIEKRIGQNHSMHYGRLLQKCQYQLLRLVTVQKTSSGLMFLVRTMC